MGKLTCELEIIVRCLTGGGRRNASSTSCSLPVQAYLMGQKRPNTSASHATAAANDPYCTAAAGVLLLLLLLNGRADATGQIKESACKPVACHSPQRLHDIQKEARNRFQMSITPGRQ